jgi:hypothetical protein
VVTEAKAQAGHGTSQYPANFMPSSVVARKQVISKGSLMVAAAEQVMARANIPPTLSWTITTPWTSTVIF